MPQTNVECGKQRETENDLCTPEAYREWVETEQSLEQSVSPKWA